MVRALAQQRAERVAALLKDISGCNRKAGYADQLPALPFRQYRTHTQTGHIRLHPRAVRALALYLPQLPEVLSCEPAICATISETAQPCERRDGG